MSSPVSFENRGSKRKLCLSNLKQTILLLKLKSVHGGRMKTPCVPPGCVSDTLGVSALGPGPSQEGLPTQEPGGILDLPETRHPQLSAWATRSLVKGLREDDCHSADFT